MADNDNTSSSTPPSISREGYDAANLALIDFKDQIAKLQDENNLLRGKLLQHESTILALQTENTDLLNKIKEKDTLISTLKVSQTMKSNDTNNDTPDVDISDIDLSSIV